jgi:hypothetical protein
MLWRQGDVLIESVPNMNIPSNAEPIRSTIVAFGEATGHRHRIANRNTAQLYRRSFDRVTYMHVTADFAELIHPEHDTLSFPRGVYRIWLQREFDGRGRRTVAD